MPFEFRTKKVDGKKVKELWFVEGLYPDIAQDMRVSEIIVKNEKTRFQTASIFDTSRCARVLALDDIVQTTTSDWYIYAEAMANFAAGSHRGQDLRVLVIGCGDGGIVRKLFEHPAVAWVDMVEIDPKVVRLAKEYLREICGDAFEILAEGSRGRLYFEDGAEFIADKENYYDLIIIDSTDPIGPARVLFETEFYLKVAKALKADGIVIRQTGSSFLQPDEMPASFWQMKSVFPSVQPFLVSVPTYFGGSFTLVAASKDPAQTFDFVAKKASKGGGPRFQWYSKQIHQAAKILPRDVLDLINKTEYGRHLVIDLYGCDYEAVSSEDRVKKFGVELCKVIGMKPFGEPVAPNFGLGKSKTAGLSMVQMIDPTVVQLIETSAIVSHYSKHLLTAHIDIFTCAGLPVDEALAFTMNYFGAQKARYFMVRRGAFTDLENNVEIKTKVVDQK